MISRVSFSIALCIISLASASSIAADEFVRAGFAEADVTPEIKEDQPVWLAGYGVGRRATGVHDPIMARCVLLEDDEKKLALVSVDLVGLQYPEVKKIREQLKQFDYVLVSSTHNHEGPDVIGIWGKTHFHRGVNEDYLELVVDRVVALVNAAEKTLTRVTAHYGTAEDESLLNDSRQPIVLDGVLRAIRFDDAESGKPAGVIVQWSCHPEALGSRNSLLTADFPFATVAALKKRYQCPVEYFSGAVGGLMAPPRGRIKDDEGNILKSGDFEFARRYGEEVAKLAEKALDSAEPMKLTPFAVSARPMYAPVENAYYLTARTVGVLKREAFQWTGDPHKRGEPLKLTDIATKTMSIETEVAYLRLGDLHVAAIPGEIYPELVYGNYQEPADPGADFPDAPLEKPVIDILPGDKWMLIGLANDEIGYIIPKRQWDSAKPYAYGRQESQYGEINSCSSHIAPLVMEALEQAVRSAESESATSAP